MDKSEREEMGKALRPVNPLDRAKAAIGRWRFSPHVSSRDLNRYGGGDHDPSDPSHPAIVAGIKFSF